ncbi:MAG: hypothetical protein WBA91_05195 [Paracoccaceae bacterium]
MAFAGLSGPLLAGGPVEKACRSTGSGSAPLCSCIQKAADMTLNGSDQRRAAKFFTNPDKAQQARADDSASAEAFWQRYSNFAAFAEDTCALGGDNTVTSG